MPGKLEAVGVDLRDHKKHGILLFRGAVGFLDRLTDEVGDLEVFLLCQSAEVHDYWLGDSHIDS